MKISVNPNIKVVYCTVKVKAKNLSDLYVARKQLLWSFSPLIKVRVFLLAIENLHSTLNRYFRIVVKYLSAQQPGAGWKNTFNGKLVR